MRLCGTPGKGVAQFCFCLLGVFHDLGLTQDVNLDLTGVFQLVLDTLGQLAGQNDHLILADLLGLHHHAYLAARLNGIALLHTGIGAGDLLQLLQTLDVILKVFTACCTRHATSVLHSTSP